MRLFYATFLSPDNMRAYQAFVDRLIEETPGSFRAVPAGTHHLTLAFLGEVHEREVSLCSAALAALRDITAFEYALSRPQLLMGRGRPRLLKVDVTENAQRIEAIQSTLIASLENRLSSLDTRLKAPHATIARCPRHLQRSRVRGIDELLDRLRGLPLPAGDRFATVHLVKSSLTPSGAVYDTIAEVSLPQRV